MNTPVELIDAADALLLDFDGPVTTLMPPPLNVEAAHRARAVLRDVEVPSEVMATTDHLAVLRWAVEHAPGRLADIEQACTDAEVQCARRSEPSPEIRDLLSRAKQRSTLLAIVSNNSEYAVRAFLERFGWDDIIDVYACRTLEVAHLMKPAPFLVRTAIQLLATEPSRCVFIGDSVSDVQAGTSAGVPVVGLAKTPTRGEQLVAAGAAALLSR